MHIYKKLYCDGETDSRKKKIIRKLKYHGGLTGVYVITVSAGEDYFDLIPGYSFKQKAYPVQELLIIGLAATYDSAVELVIKMIEDFSARYGTCQFKNLFLQEKEMNFTGYNRKY
ncbi:MAG: hypothetical protein J1E61_02245 [Lachnospiraceae bacterium]|nr:hypothetical protein [Lachnospiraceae bacterium]